MTSGRCARSSAFRYGGNRMADRNDGSNPDQKRFETYGQHLRWYANHDYYIAISLIIATFTIAPFAIFIIPFFAFGLIIVESEFLESDLRAELRAAADVPRNVLLLQTKGFQAHIFSLPFLSILKIPEHIIKSRNTEEISLIIKHELAHHRRHDTSKIIWIISAILLLIFYFITALSLWFSPFQIQLVEDPMRAREIVFIVFSSILLIVLFSIYVLYRTEKFPFLNRNIGNITTISFALILGLGGSWIARYLGYFPEPYASVDPSLEVRDQTIRFWSLVILACAVLLFMLLRGMCHRIEYHADFEATEDDLDAHVRYWARRASPKIKERAASWLVGVYNQFIDPTDRQRHAALTGQHRASSWGLFFYTLIWSAACGFLLLRALTNGRSSYGESALQLTNDLGLFGLLMMVGIIGYGVHSMMRIHGRFFRLEVVSVFAGYAFGAVFAFTSVYLFERSAFDLEHFRPNGTSDFLLVSVASFFPLLLVASLTANFAKIKTPLAMAQVLSCAVLATVVASGTLIEDLRVEVGIAFGFMIVLAIVFLVVVILGARLALFLISLITGRPRPGQT